MTLLLLVSCTLCALALGLTCFNLWTWPRGQVRKPVDASRLSILIPARNEIQTIEQAVRAALACDPLEVLVYDDASTDGTTEVLEALAREDVRVHILPGQPLPKGWVGKPHACHHLGLGAKGDVLLFVDADTILAPSGPARLLGLFASHGADLVTAVPKQQMGSWFERLVIPLLHLTYTSWFPLLLTWRSTNVKFLAANGQLLAIKASTYHHIGGFERVRHEVVDDMALCRVVKRHGHTVVFADGFHVATCRMYRGAKEVWEGFSKNIYQGLGAWIPGLVLVLALYTLAFVLPYLVLPLGVWLGQPDLWHLALLCVAMNLTLRALLAIRFDHPPLESVVLHPVAVCGLMAIAINSALWHWRGAVAWSGRTYDTRQGAHEVQPEQAMGDEAAR